MLIVGFGMPPKGVEANTAYDTNPYVFDANTYQNMMEKRLEEKAKKILDVPSESSPLTKDDKEDISEYYVDIYMPVEGCSLFDDLPEDSDINYVKPKPKKVTPSPISTNSNLQIATISSGGIISMSTDERYWLEKLIEAEAADEPYEGKVAVATTIANRIESKSFPDSVMSVIKENNGKWHQYSPWDDGSIHRRTPSKDTLRAIGEVFDKGVRNLPKETAYFAMKNIAFDNWMGRTRQHVTTIKNHAFFSEYKK